MKPVVADFATKVYCVRIVPSSGPVIRLAGYPVDLKMSNGETYLTESGYEFSGLGSSSTFASSSIDLNGILQMGAIERDALMAGVYDNARVYLFATSWADPVEDEEPCGLYFFGKIQVTDEQYNVQLMGAIDVLSQSTGRTYSATCPWTLFDETLDGYVPHPAQSRCSGPRSAPDGPVLSDFKVTGTITAVGSQYSVTDSSRAESDDYFAYGSIKFTTGQNAGLKSKEIKYFASGLIQVHEAFFYMPEVGDQYEMIPGCRKRHSEDCVTKWSNGKNFGGQPHVPTPSIYSQVGRGAS